MSKSSFKFCASKLVSTSPKPNSINTTLSQKEKPRFLFELKKLKKKTSKINFCKVCLPHGFFFFSKDLLLFLTQKMFFSNFFFSKKKNSKKKIRKKHFLSQKQQ